MDLIYDTETTGFPNFKAPSSAPDQPHLVQLACILAEGDYIDHTWSTIVKCPIPVDPSAFAVHGISMERSQEEGIDLIDALGIFGGMMYKADRVIAHNTNFDTKIMKIAFAKAGIDSIVLMRKKRFCTMFSLTNHLKLPSPSGRGYKWPKLIEAYTALVDSEGFQNAHQADADALACFKVLRAIEENPEIELKQVGKVLEG